MTQPIPEPSGDVDFIASILPELKAAVAAKDETRVQQLLNRMFLESGDPSALAKAFIDAYTATDPNPPTGAPS